MVNVSAIKLVIYCSSVAGNLVDFGDLDFYALLVFQSGACVIRLN